MPVTVIRLTWSRDAAGELVVRLGAGLLDEYLEFLAGRCRPNTVPRLVGRGFYQETVTVTPASRVMFPRVAVACMTALALGA